MTPWPYPFWIAHRGAGLSAPENTLASFRRGLDAGFRMVECDVKLSADGVPFLLHDTDLERTTSGLGIAGDHAWSALSRLDAGSWHSPAYAGEPMPTLEAAARCLIARGAFANLEIKPTPGTEALTGERVAVAAQALWAAQAVPPLLSSFEPGALVAAQRAAPALPRALLLEAFEPGWEDTARALDCVAVVFEAALVDAALVAAQHAQGRRVLAYTVNAPEEVSRLRAAGIDGLITDEVDRFGSVADTPMNAR